MLLSAFIREIFRSLVFLFEKLSGTKMRGFEFDFNICLTNSVCLLHRNLISNFSSVERDWRASDTFAHYGISVDSSKQMPRTNVKRI